MTTSLCCKWCAARSAFVMLLAFLAVLGTALLGTLPGVLLAEETDGVRANWATKAFQKNCEAVVCIQGDKIDEYGDLSKNGGRESGKSYGKSYNGMGTGIIIDERGYIVTNYHVVEGIRKIQVTTFDSTQYVGTLLARDTDTDLAIIKIQARKPLKTITLGRSHDLMPGENCLAIGNPYGYAFSLTDGRISGIERKVDVNDSLVYRVAIQTNTEINPGNSGGPLINIEGEMIGINAAIRQGAAGIAFAIPIDQVVDVSAKLMEEISRKNVMHGLSVRQTESTDRVPLDRSSGQRFQVVIDSVASGSPAAEAGLCEGDVITVVGNHSIHNVLDFYRAFVELSPGEDIAMNIARNNEIFDLALNLRQARTGQLAHTVRRNSVSNPLSTASAAQPKTARLGTARQGKGTNAGDYDDLVWDTLGIRYTPIPTEKYQQEYPTKYPGFPYGGIVIKAVREGSPMAEKGIMAEDVIVGIHDWTMTSNNDVQYIAKNWPTIRPANKKVEVLLFRTGQLYNTFVPCP